MMKFDKRLRALERRFHADPVILYFADGSTREICGRSDYLLRLFYAACGGGDLSPEQAAQLDLIRQSVDAQEPSARMTELIRCFLHSPAKQSRPSIRPSADNGLESR